MKAIIENKNTYQVTSEKGDFFITKDNKGKLKMFAKHLVEVVEIEDMPKAKIFTKKASSKPFTAEEQKKWAASVDASRIDRQRTILSGYFLDSEVDRRMKQFKP